MADTTMGRARALGQHLRTAELRAAGTFPRVVCLCGSTRFKDEFVRQAWDRTLAGEIVLTIGCDTKIDAALGITPAQKAALDELHKQKIELADYVFVINRGGYIGDSTRGEIAHALAHRVPVEYLEPVETPRD